MHLNSSYLSSQHFLFVIAIYSICYLNISFFPSDNSHLSSQCVLFVVSIFFLLVILIFPICHLDISARVSIIEQKCHPRVSSLPFPEFDISYLLDTKAAPYFNVAIYLLGNNSFASFSSLSHLLHHFLKLSC